MVIGVGFLNDFLVVVLALVLMGISMPNHFFSSLGMSMSRNSSSLVSTVSIMPDDG